MRAPGRTLAELFAVVEAETPMGGRAVSYEPLGVAWLACGAVQRRERAGGDAAPAILQTMEAVTRADERLEAGRVLRFRGGDWRIAGTESERPRPGRMTLKLERTR